jgi:two-component system sensor kinase FixL
VTGETENQASDDNARLRAVLDAAVDGIITIDERGTVEAANPAAEKLFGYSSSEMIGRNVNLLMPSPYQAEHDGYLANYSRTGVRKIIGIGREVQGRRKDGTIFPLYLAVSEVSFGHRRVFTGFVHDLTDLKRAEEQATQLGRILEDSLNEIFIFDAETMKFVFVNRGALTNIGYTAKEMFEMTPVDIKPEFTQQQFEDSIEPLNTRAKSELRFDTVHQRKDSSRYDVHIRLQKANWQGRGVFIAIILDVTDQKRAQNELAALNAELEQRVERRTRELRETQAQLIRKEKLAALGQLSGGVAHEIRNPLGVIKNSVYYLKMTSDQLDEDARECVDEIEREVETANRIVSELLDFTRDPPSHPEAFALKQAIANAIRVARVPAGVRLSVADTDDSVQLLADQGQVERVLTNLIRNAWQAMSGNGDLSIQHSVQNDHAVIDVRDTGVGITAENLANVFEPLFTTKAKGIGLGLAVSRRYAQRNGGSLTVESQAGEGTVFHFSVPLNGVTK